MTCMNWSGKEILSPNVVLLKLITSTEQVSGRIVEVSTSWLGNRYKNNNCTSSILARILSRMYYCLAFPLFFFFLLSYSLLFLFIYLKCIESKINKILWSNSFLDNIFSSDSWGCIKLFLFSFPIYCKPECWQWKETSLEFKAKLEFDYMVWQGGL